MIELQIDVTDLEDIRTAKSSVVKSSIASAAAEVLRGGGRVVLKRSYCNAPDDVFRVYVNADAFEKDWQDFFAQAEQA